MPDNTPAVSPPVEPPKSPLQIAAEQKALALKEEPKVVQDQKGPKGPIEQVTKEVPFVWDDTRWNSKLEAIEASKTSVAGKPNYNPFVWINENVTPLVKRYKSKERSKELFDSLMRVPSTIPCIDPNWEPEVVPKGPPLPRRA